MNQGARFPSPAERRRRGREEMTEAILNAARQIMREHGVAALNLSAVARLVGVKTPSLYEYFDGKAELYDALFRLGCTLFDERVEAITRQEGDPFEQIGRAMEGYMNFAQQYPELWSLVFERPVPGFVPSAESMAVSRRILDRGQEMMAGFIASGRIRTDLSSEQAVDFIDAVMHGLTAGHMANQPELPAGTGRFGSLIPIAVQFFRNNWQPPTEQEESDADGDDGRE